MKKSYCVNINVYFKADDEQEAEKFIDTLFANSEGDDVFYSIENLDEEDTAEEEYDEFVEEEVKD